MLYKPDLGHLYNCTLCSNQGAARLAARRHQLRVVSGAVHLLADDAALETWSHVVHELERPRKARVRFQQPRAPEAPAASNGAANNGAAPPLTRAHAMPRLGFGMPGTVLYEGGRFRAWLGQSIQRYAESTDGVEFDEPRGIVSTQKPKSLDLHSLLSAFAAVCIRCCLHSLLSACAAVCIR